MGDSSLKIINKLAFIFPGQGSQSVGMLKELAVKYAVIEETFGDASDVLGYDLWSLIQNGPAAELNKTDKTQPAMLTSGVAVWKTWNLLDGQKPDVMAGHSLGEYTALVCSGALEFETAVKLVSERGRLMQQSVPAGTGAMAAILGLDDELIISLCDKGAQGEVVSAVNFNSPGQVVIAGMESAVNRVIELARESKAKRAILLPVSVPSHCALMEPAASQMKQLLENVEISEPKVAVVNNVDVEINTDTNKIKDSLVRQLISPVRWVESINKIAHAGIETVMECGPGKVLTALNKRIDRSLITLPLHDPESLTQALDQIMAKAGD